MIIINHSDIYMYNVNYDLGISQKSLQNIPKTNEHISIEVRCINPNFRQAHSSTMDTTTHIKLSEILSEVINNSNSHDTHSNIGIVVQNQCNSEEGELLGSISLTTDVS